MALVSVTPPKEDKPHRLRCAGRGRGEGGGAASPRAPPPRRRERGRGGTPQIPASARWQRPPSGLGRLHLPPPQQQPLRPGPPRAPARGDRAAGLCCALPAPRSGRRAPLLPPRPSPCSFRRAPAATGEAGSARVAALGEAKPPAAANGVPAPRPPPHPLSPPRSSTARSRPPPPRSSPSPPAALPRGRPGARSAGAGDGARLGGAPRGEAAAAISALRSAALLWK